MMTPKQEILIRLAREAMEDLRGYRKVIDVAIAVIDEALAEQPVQQREPATWMKDCADFWEHYTYISEASQENYKAEAQMWVEKLRTSPPASKPWVGLTDEETRKINQEVWGYVSADHTRMWDYARAIEAKLREKNA